MQFNCFMELIIIFYHFLSFFIKDYSTWVELRSLEEIVGRRYLTHESDDERWQRYEKSIRVAAPATSEGGVSFL